MDHFEDWHAQDLEKILARGTTVQGWHHHFPLSSDHIHVFCSD
jgi:hypothetical protein